MAWGATSVSMSQQGGTVFLTSLNPAVARWYSAVGTVGADEQFMVLLFDNDVRNNRTATLELMSRGLGAVIRVHRLDWDPPRWSHNLTLIAPSDGLPLWRIAHTAEAESTLQLLTPRKPTSGEVEMPVVQGNLMRIGGGPGAAHVDGVALRALRLVSTAPCCPNHGGVSPPTPSAAVNNADCSTPFLRSIESGSASLLFAHGAPRLATRAARRGRARCWCEWTLPPPLRSCRRPARHL
jgi:hypothetical protein